MSTVAWVVLGVVVWLAGVGLALAICTMAGRCDPDREVEQQGRHRIGR